MGSLVTRSRSRSCLERSLSSLSRSVCLFLDLSSSLSRVEPRSLVSSWSSRSYAKPPSESSSSEGDRGRIAPARGVPKVGLVGDVFLYFCWKKGSLEVAMGEEGGVARKADETGNVGVIAEADVNGG